MMSNLFENLPARLIVWDVVLSISGPIVDECLTFEAIVFLCRSKGSTTYRFFSLNCGTGYEPRTAILDEMWILQIDPKSHAPSPSSGNLLVGP